MIYDQIIKQLMEQHFNVYGLPDPLHSDNGKEFLNNLWRELFKIQLYYNSALKPFLKICGTCP